MEADFIYTHTMAVAAQQNNNREKRPSNRRRKKRRTEDFSSSSESSSSSSSSSSESDNDNAVEEEDVIPNTEEITMDDIEIETNGQTTKSAKKAPDNLSIEQKQQLNTIPFSTTSISEVTNPNTANALKSIPNLTEVSNSIEQSKQEINTRFLKLMTTEFGNDIDELRKKPDFKEASLSVLAKTLQSGANMFDVDVLEGLLDEGEKAT
ncbi:RSA3 [Candida theae]|uniref:Ribosome assembly protein 3 n=1 Tax=Candida theae TaxID=1198502 RepID=A0AAD5FZK7_9ASCO|nr:RSA3 [Candida theae]KAI5961569.1 RSA3 [Candida theae]